MSISSSQHRSLQPTGPPAQSSSQQQLHARLSDSFDAIRSEFDGLTQEFGTIRNQRDDFESKLMLQVTEMGNFHRQISDLEVRHGKVREQYEEELARLRTELTAARQGVPVGVPPHPSANLSSLGLSNNAGQLAPANLALGAQQQQQPYDPYYNRERGDRERDRDNRDNRDRERDREREREREHRERDRERAERERADRERDTRERDRPNDQRDTKRLKTVKTDRPDQFSPSLGPGPTPKLPPASSTTGPGTGPGLAPPALAPSQQPVYLASPSTISIPPLPEPALPPISSSSNGGFPNDVDLHEVPPELKKEGTDWFAVFNPKVKRGLDVSLVHTLMHESVVCCVRFSADGKYLATGCNRSAQIYDTKTGIKTCVLVDEHAAKAGDLYIRSVCFSPDGLYLATGAEDKQIRIWDIAKKRICTIFDGHQQEIYSLDFSRDGKLIVSGSGDKTARIWSMEGLPPTVLSINDPDSASSDAGVTSVAISPNGQLVAAGSLDNVVRIWDVVTGVLVERLRGHRDSVYSVAFTPDGKGLVSGSLDKTLKYWDVSSLMGNTLKSRKEGNAAINGPGATTGPGGVVRKDSQCTMNFIGHKDYVLSVAVSHDGDWVVSGSKDRGVQFWDSRTAVVQCMLQGHKNSVISIDLSPAGNVLATGSGDYQARIWNYTPGPV